MKYATYENGSPRFAPYAVEIGRETRVTDSLTEAEANSIGFKLVVDEAPATDAEHYAVPTGWTDGDRIVRVYELRAAVPSPVLISKAKVAAKVDAWGKTAEFFSWLNSKAQYATAWFNGSASVVYNPGENGGDLESLLSALGVVPGDIESLIGECREA